MKSSLESISESLAAGQIREASAHLRSLVLQPLGPVQWQRLNRLISSHEADLRRDLAQKTSRIGVVGSYTTRMIVDILPAHFLAEGAWAEVYEGDYGSFSTETLTPDSGLFQFDPDFILIATGLDYIHEWPLPGASEVEVEALAESVMNGLRARWAAIRAHSRARIIQHNFEPPPVRSLGHLEGRVPYSATRFIQRLNQKLWQHDGNDIYILDIHQAAQDQGSSRWSSPRWYFHSKHGFDPSMAGYYSLALGGLLRALLGRTRKVLVCDLDNTLWGGVIGDDGLDAIQLGGGTATGEAFAALQRYVKNLGLQGTLLAVCSKNELETAKEPFNKHPECPLKVEDFSAWECSWGLKSAGLQSIAKKLNVGIESLVFIDDNPAECAEVRSVLPEVTILHLDGDPAGYVRQLDELRLFSPLEVTQEDFGRSRSLRAAVHLETLQSGPEALPAYLKSLEMKAVIRDAREPDLPRVEQLFKKTNQFNWNGESWSRAELEASCQSTEQRIVAAWLSDKHSPHGLVSCLLLEKSHAGELMIKNWVMSCRVFSRTLEDAILCHLVQVAQELGCSKLVAKFLRSAKNAYVESFIQRAGFAENGGIYSLHTNPPPPSTEYITLVGSL